MLHRFTRFVVLASIVASALIALSLVWVGDWLGVVSNVSFALFAALLLRADRTARRTTEELRAMTRDRDRLRQSLNFADDRERHATRRLRTAERELAILRSGTPESNVARRVSFEKPKAAPAPRFGAVIAPAPRPAQRPTAYSVASNGDTVATSALASTAIAVAALSSYDTPSAPETSSSSSYTDTSSSSFGGDGGTF